MPLLQFLRERVFTPLGMKSVVNIDQERLSEADPTGYMRYGLGPLRPAPKEGKGWLFAAGGLAMTAQDLARWDISLIEQKLMKPSSYNQLGTEVLLKNGLASHYGLGVDVLNEAGRRALAHGGEVSGFTAQNVVFPEDRAAIVVLTNQDAAGASGDIARAIAPLLFTTDDPAAARKLEQARKIFEGLQRGTIDRSLFTENANSYFGEQALKDFATGLAPLGTPQDFTQTRQALRGGMILRVYRVRFPKKTLRAWTFEMPDGKLEQYQIAPVD
jgi:CubicO group peptidase (beta-lactamase class C family)